jgi:hypothetical protein
MAQIRNEYVKYLIVNPLKQTQTCMGGYHMSLSHDQVNRFMRRQKLRPRHLWQAVRGDVVASSAGASRAVCRRFWRAADFPRHAD